jgi:nitroreductase
MERVPPDDRQSGSAAIEFLTVGLLLLVPLVYLVLTLGALQAASFAADGLARQAVRVYVLASTDAEGRSRMAASVAAGLADWHLPASALQLALTCDQGDCRTPRGTVTVTARVAVALPLLPPALHLGAPGSIAVTARAAERMSMFAVAP